MATHDERAPRAPLAVTVGDPAGIGPEILPRALAALEGRARLLAVGPRALAPDGLSLVDSPEDLPEGPAAAWLDSGAEGPVAEGKHRLGEVQACCGDAALRALRAAHDLAMAGRVGAVVTGPVNKAALHAAGARVEGQTELLSQWAGAERTEMIGFAGKLRVMLATRHMPLRAAIDRLDVEHVLDRLHLLHGALEFLGVPRPRLALAGLNPHAGEGGLLGAEDGEILAPAAARAREAGLEVVGPVSPDSVFAEGVAGVHDGILALYHDQAFIPLKLVAQGRGVTFIAGLPYLRFSPMHGTAFDIVGQRDGAGHPVADPGNLVEALEVARHVLLAREG